ncbi:MAG: branched-chain amino acid transaminase [Candidatus Azambacteria bacterium]|nr:branched-chain amino acid transaminase [Candidatus Azambacteria bacterium]
MKTQYVWLDGGIIPLEKATVPLLTHSLHYGSAVFEGIRFYNTGHGPAVFRLHDHIARLFFSAKTMGMRIPFSQKTIEQAILALIKKNGLTSGYIRPLVYYGEKMGLSPTDAPLHVAIACWPWGKYLTKETVAVKISSFMRVHPRTSVMTAKISGNYANSVLASLEAHREGYDEALFLDYKGNIAEGPGENIFFVKGKTVVTPPEGSILPGITRNSLMAIAKDLGYTIKEQTIKPKDLKKFDEAFFTGTAVEVNGIGKIDDVIFNKGKEGQITKHIRETYAQIVSGALPRYKKWLAYIQ